MARTPVTQGAVSRVPFSGASVPALTGQGTCPSSLSRAAAQSEPHGLLDTECGWPVYGCGVGTG